MHFTGIYDVKGNKIREGDICYSRILVIESLVVNALLLSYYCDGRRLYVQF